MLVGNIKLYDDFLLGIKAYFILFAFLLFNWKKINWIINQVVILYSEFQYQSDLGVNITEEGNRNKVNTNLLDNIDAINNGFGAHINMW